MKNLSSKDPTVICRELRLIEKIKPTETQVREVVNLLKSKYESVTSVASQVLASWSSSKSLEIMFSTYEEVSTKNGTNNIQNILASSIGKIVSECNSTDWAVKKFLNLQTWQARSNFMPVMSSISLPRAKSAFIKAWKNADRKLKHSILVAASATQHPDSKEFFLKGTKDDDHYIKEFSLDTVNGNYNAKFISNLLKELNK